MYLEHWKVHVPYFVNSPLCSFYDYKIFFNINSNPTTPDNVAAIKCTRREGQYTNTPTPTCSTT